LRDHTILQKPFAIDRSKMVQIETPEAWRDDLDDKTVEVLPLVNDTDRPCDDGWCTYTYAHNAPELEVFCGGVNSKTPKAGGLWRQGNLMHFGFEQSPTEMNQNGRWLLLNSIAYIARFTDDRPIANTPSPFAPARTRFSRRTSVKRAIERGELGLGSLKYYLSSETYAKLNEMTQTQREQWYAQAGPFLRADEKGKIVVDDEAHSFGISPATLEFFDQAIRAIAQGSEEAEVAQRLLERYAPSGPERGDANADARRVAWQSWWTEHKQFLFFSDTGGYRWYVDGLAKSRDVPTQELRGVRRATLDPIKVEQESGGLPRE